MLLNISILNLKEFIILESKERILISASNIFIIPSITGSTIGIKAPSCPVENSQSIKIEYLHQLNQNLSQVSKDTALSLIKSKEIKKLEKLRMLLSLSVMQLKILMILKSEILLKL